MLEKETVSGDNALRIIRGKAPIEEDNTEQLERERELSNAYFILSLVDNYSLRDGQVVERLPYEEINAFSLALQRELQDELEHLSAQNNWTKEEHARSDLLNGLSSAMAQKKQIMQKYSTLLYQHSLDTVNVQEILEKIKREL